MHISKVPGKQSRLFAVHTFAYALHARAPNLVLSKGCVLLLIHTLDRQSIRNGSFKQACTSTHQWPWLCSVLTAS
jgi:hypothetical protein